ncbi:MAG: hypothetical protein NVSMB16_05000 [Acidimicrobiales bacterium]
MTLLVLTTADTEILALRSVIESLPEGFPTVRAANPAGLLPGEPALDGVELVLVRLLGGRSAWEEGFDDLAGRCRRRGIPLIALGGEAAPDADLAARSTVPAATVAASSDYLSHGGLANTEHLLRFLADTVLVGGWGFEAPVTVPDTGVWGGEERLREVSGQTAARRPVIGIVFYRAHVLSGNTLFVDALVDAIGRRGGVAVPVWCYSLRGGGAEIARILATAGATAVITTVLAAGSDAGGVQGDGWDAGPLGDLGVPVLQAMCATTSADQWRANDSGLSPLDVAMAVAIPEFDGRIITAPISTKEVVDDGDTLGWPVLAYRPLPDRIDRVAGLAVRLASLASTPPAQRKVAVVLSAYPTKRARIGNAVALDTPASVIVLLHRLRAEGYRVDRIPADGDALMAELADGLTYDREHLTPRQMTSAVGRWSADSYVEWWNSDAVPAGARARVESTWGHAPGVVHTDAAGALCFAGLDLGGVRRGAAAPGFRGGPDRGLPLSGSGADAPLPRLLPVARPRMGRPGRGPCRQARHP